MISNIRQNINKPAESVYTFLHNSVSDYPYYISFIRQGTDGRLTTIDQFTTEKQTPGFIHVFYLILGQLGRTIGLSPTIIYFTSRIILGFILLLVSYKFIALYFDNYWGRLITFGLYLTAASFPKEIHFDGGFSVWTYLYWWTELDPLNRITFIPHFLFGHLSLILIIYLFLKNNNIFILGLCGFITGFVHPPSLGMTYYIFVCLLIIKVIRVIISNDIKEKKFCYEIIRFILFFIMSVPSLIYIFYTAKYIFPWTLMGIQESLFYFVPIIEYILAIGPIFPLAIIGAVVMIIAYKKEKDDRYTILFLWIIIDVLMIPVSELIHYSSLNNILPTFSNIRFLSMMVHLPLSIFSGILLIRLYKKNIQYFSVVLFIYLIMTLPLFYNSIKLQYANNPLINKYVYVERNIAESINFINNNERDKTVLANEYINQLFPLFGSSKIYFGQTIYTDNNQQKKAEIEKILSGSIDDCDFHQFIIDNKIEYILVSDKKEKDAFNKFKSINLRKEYPPIESKFPIVYRIEQLKEMKDICVNERSPL